MPRDELKATDANLKGLLEGDKVYQAPLLQRRYVWGRKELDELWDDIDQIMAGIDKSRFLGAVVLQDRSSGLAFEPQTYWIIDGQQRLTTLYVLLLAIAILAEGRRNRRLASDIVQRLLNQSSRHVNEPKLLPTNADLRQFGDLLKELKTVTVSCPPPSGKKRGKLSKMFLMLQSDLQLRLKEHGRGYLNRLSSLVLTKLKFVQILTSEEENPHQVFDRLNNAGQRLEIIDLVRNAVFQKFGNRVKEQDAFFNSSWSVFEESLDEGINGYFFPFALIHRPNTTQAQVFGDLKSRWRNEQPADILADLNEFVPEYRALTVGVPLRLGAEITTGVDRLYRMPAPTSTYPFLMRLLNQVRKRKLAEHKASQVLWLIESFLVRRALAGLEPTGLHALFKLLWQETGGKQDLILSTIDRNPTIHFPTDKEFSEDVRESELYRRRLAKYVLMEYELDLPGGDKIPAQVRVKRRISPLASATTIDHVMPQKPTPYWTSVVPAETYARLKHTWANLVPMTAPFNSRKQGKSWDRVRKAFDTETIYKTPRRLAKLKSWNERSITRRSIELSQWALRRWPRNPR